MSSLIPTSTTHTDRTSRYVPTQSFQPQHFDSMFKDSEPALTEPLSVQYRPMVVDYSVDERLNAMCSLGRFDIEVCREIIRNTGEGALTFHLNVYNKIYHDLPCVELYLQKTLTTQESKIKYFITMCTTRRDLDSQFISKSFKPEYDYYEVRNSGLIKSLFASLSASEFVDVINGIGSSYLYTGINDGNAMVNQHFTVDGAESLPHTWSPTNVQSASTKSNDFDDLLFTHPSAKDETSFANADVSMILVAVRHGVVNLITTALTQRVNIKYLGEVVVPLYVYVLLKSHYTNGNGNACNTLSKDVIDGLYNTSFNINGFSLLHIAIIEQNKSLFDDLLTRVKGNAEYVNRCDRFGNTPLMCALMNVLNNSESITNFVLPLLQLSNVSLIHRSEIAYTPYVILSEYSKLVGTPSKSSTSDETNIFIKGSGYDYDLDKKYVPFTLNMIDAVKSASKTSKPFGNQTSLKKLTGLDDDNMFTVPKSIGNSLDDQYKTMFSTSTEPRLPTSTTEDLAFKKGQLSGHLLSAFKRTLSDPTFSYDHKLLVLVIATSNLSTELFTSVINTSINRSVLESVLVQVKKDRDAIDLTDSTNPYVFYQNYNYYCDIISIIERRLTTKAGWFM